MSDGGFMFEKTDGGYEVTGLDGPAAEDLVIPAEHGGEPVVGIGDHAFACREEIRSALIPETVKHIGEGAFQGCFRVMEVVNLSPLKILPGIGGHGDVALRAKAVKTSEGDRGAFFTDAKGYMFYDSGDGLCLYGYRGDGNSLRLPCFDGRTYGICDGAFSGLPVTDLVMPPCVTSVGAEAFLGCACLKHVSLGDGVAYVGESAFEGCEALEDAETGRGLVMLGDRAFRGCESLRDVYLPAGLRYIGDGAFEGCPCLRSLVVPATVSRIGRGAFRTSDELGAAHALDVFLFSDSDGIRPGPKKWRKPSDPEEGEGEDGEPMTLYVYSAEKPFGKGRFWRYDEVGNPVKW